MKVSINKETLTFIGKLKEEDKMVDVINIMSKEINSLTYLEHFGKGTDHEMVEITLCYSAGEATVATVKESYSDAKKAA
tara:strand:- start:70 stop:306 length:237 start_codon:yes stop_codon:yes gene_type:complete